MKAERANIDDKSPHLQLTFTDDAGDHRAAINVKSADKHDSRLVYWLNRKLQLTITDDFQNLNPGFHALHGKNGLDYIRQKLLKIEDGAVLPHDIPGPNNDILDELIPILKDGIHHKATIYLFGSMFADHGATSGPDTGMHNIHMNQGSLPQFDNGTYQDGALFLYFDHDDHWEGVFLGFASQRIPTWDDSGKPKHDAQELVDIIENAGGDVEDDPTGN
jgi:uncharacterized protein YukJ